MARTADEQRRRAIVEAAMRGEAEAKNEFATSSRKIAQDFDRAREATKNDANRGKSEAAASFENGQVKAAQEHSAAVKPILDLIRMADGLRDRLATIAADYAKVKLNTEAPIPVRGELLQVRRPGRRAVQPPLPDGGPLKLLEGLIIPKVLKGQSEVWIYVVVILLMVGGRRDGRRRGRPGSAAASPPARPSPSCFASGSSSSPRPSSNGSMCRSCSRWPTPITLQPTVVAWSTTGSRTHGRSFMRRREEDLKKVEANYAKAFRAAEAQRDERLRKINEVYATRWSTSRRPSNATCATPSMSTTAGWPSSKLRLRRTPPARGEIPGAQGTDPDPPRDLLDGDGRVLAERDAGGRGRDRSDRARDRRLRSGLGRPRLADPAAPPAAPAGAPHRARSRSTWPDLPGGLLGRRPPDGGLARLGSPSRHCARSPPRPTC